MSDSLRPHALYGPWNSPGQNTGVGSLSLLQGIFPTQESNPGLLHCRQILYQLSHKGSPRILEWVAYPFFSGSSWLRNWIRVFCIAGRLFTNRAIREAQFGQYFIQYFSHLMQRANSLEQTDAGKVRRQQEKRMTGWGDWMASLTQWTWVWETLGNSEGQGSLECCSPCDCKESDTTEQLNNKILLSTITTIIYYLLLSTTTSRGH